MLHRIQLTTAATLQDLRNRIDHAINRLGEDALWTGHIDGRIYVWRAGHYVDLSIEPKTKYSYELDDVEVVR